MLKIRSCPTCGRVVKLLSGLSRHWLRCLVLTGKIARVIWDDPQSCNNEAFAQVVLYGFELYSDSDPMAVDESMEDIDSLSNRERNGVSLDREESMDPNPDLQAKHEMQERLSTTASIRVNTYEEVTSLKASKAMNRPQHEYNNKRAEDQSYPTYPAYTPF